MFYEMNLHRRVEIACDEIYKLKEVRGFCHLMDGQVLLFLIVRKIGSYYSRNRSRNYKRGSSDYSISLPWISAGKRDFGRKLTV
jgi:hypothetical protein